MGIKFYCPSCDKRLNVKSYLAGKSGFCPQCQAKVQIPEASEPKRPKSPDAGLSTVLRQPELLGAGVAASATPVKVQPSGNGHGNPHIAVAATASPPAPQSQPAAGYVPVTPQPIGGGQPAPSQPVHTQPVQAVAGPAAFGASPMTTAAPVTAAPVTPSPAFVDPIAEAPHAVWYVRPPAGGQYGPAAGDLMRKWMGEGRVSADSLVWREGWPDWRKAAKIFPSLAPATAPATAAPQVSVAPVNAAANAPRRTLKSPRKKNSTTLAITAIAILVLLSLGLLIGLLYVLGVI